MSKRNNPLKNLTEVLPEGLEVSVFKEVRTGVWTVWDKDRKKHLFWARSLILSECEFIVVEKGRQSVVRTRQKKPHAWVRGVISNKNTGERDGFESIEYNPFLMKKFRFKKDKKDINIAGICLFLADGKVLAKT